MDLSYTHRFTAPISAVMEMYADERFARARADATGAVESDVLVDGEPGGPFSVSIHRVIPTDTVRADVRGLVGRTITVRYTEAWDEPDGEDRHGTFAVEIVGAPARAAGTMTLTPDGTDTDVAIEGTVRSSALLLSGTIAQAVGEALETGIEREFAAADVWLAG